MIDKKDREVFLQERAKGLYFKPEFDLNTALHIYITLPHTVEKDGIFSPSKAPFNKLEHYKSRASEYLAKDIRDISKNDILKYLETWFSGRSRAVSVLTEPIPMNNDLISEKQKNFRDSSDHYIIPSYKELVKLGIAEKLYLSVDGGKDKLVPDVDKAPINWKLYKNSRQEYTFKGIRHYFVVLKNGIIPSRYCKKLENVNTSDNYEASVKFDSLESFKSPKDLIEFYKSVKYGAVNCKTDDDYDKNWRLLSSSEMLKLRLGVCYDTVAFSIEVFNKLKDYEYRMYFAWAKGTADEIPDSAPTHTFFIYKAKDGYWKWIEGSWGVFKFNEWRMKNPDTLAHRIVEMLVKDASRSYYYRELKYYPKAGCTMKEFVRQVYSFSDKILVDKDTQYHLNESEEQDIEPANTQSTSKIVANFRKTLPKEMNIDFGKMVIFMPFPMDDIDKIRTHNIINTTRIGSELGRYTIGQLILPPWGWRYATILRENSMYTQPLVVKDVIRCKRAEDHPLWAMATPKEKAFLNNLGGEEYEVVTIEGPNYILKLTEERYRLRHKSLDELGEGIKDDKYYDIIKYRCENNIEVLKIERSFDQFLICQRNWFLMTDEEKAKSNAFSNRRFNSDNISRIPAILREYKNDIVVFDDAEKYSGLNNILNR